MQPKRFVFAARALLASGALLGTAAAHAIDWSGFSWAAANRYNVTQSQEALVRPGMTSSEVQMALGPPAHAVKFPSEPGPTWTYRVTDTPFTHLVFDVDFGADGKVVAASQRMDDSGGGGSGDN